MNTVMLKTCCTNFSLIKKCVYFFFFMYVFILPFSAAAQEFTHISAKNLEYLSETSEYIAKGSVTVTFGEAVLSADEMQISSKTYDAVALGNVTYKDLEAAITAERIEMNLKTKQGVIYESSIFYKIRNFHIRSNEIMKTGDRTFVLDRASVTTCDGQPPDWHISGSDVTVTQHEKIKGWHGAFNIKEVPVLYTPYFWAPLNNDRQTGFLFPGFGYSTKRGYYYKQGFFWAIKENQDATFYGDYYDKKGFGQGLDYRYILSPGTDGEIWMYHVRDDEPSRNLGELKSFHNQKLPYNMSGYLKLHAVSDYDYYKTMDSTSEDRFGLSTWDPEEFGFESRERLQKYLESDLQVSKQYDRGRIYLLAQGRQSLEGSSSEIPQSLPELGFILNTQSVKYFSFDMSAKGVNFWREKGQEGTRFDIYPNLYFSYGRTVNITQRAGIRETAYFLNEPGEYDDRFIYDLETTVTTKFFRKYTNLIHLIEPSLGYVYIPHVDQDEALLFDATDFIPKTNSIRYALTNRLSATGSKKLEARFRLSQSYSFLNTDEHFTPVIAEATLTSPRIDFELNASYDVNDDTLTETIGSIRLKDKAGFIEFGKNLRKSTDLDQYTFEAGLYAPMKIMNTTLPFGLRSKLEYDAKNGRIQELDVSFIYKRQCWGYTVTYNERPDEYQIIFAIELLGLGTFSLGSI